MNPKGPTDIMFSSPGDYQKLKPHRVPFRSLRYLNTGILVFATIIAIALLVTTRSKESDQSSSKVGKNNILADNYQDASQSSEKKVLRTKLPVPETRQFIERIISAFSEPSLIDYANQQGLDIPGSVKLLNDSSQLGVRSGSPSPQAKRSPPNY
jgi:hypothetical protein